MGIMEHPVDFEGKKRVLRVAYRSSGLHTDFPYNSEDDLRKLASGGGGPRVDEMNFAVVYAKWPSESAIPHSGSWYIEDNKAENLVRKVFLVKKIEKLRPVVAQTLSTSSVSFVSVLEPEKKAGETIYDMPRFDGKRQMLEFSDKLVLPIRAFQLISGDVHLERLEKLVQTTGNLAFVANGVDGRGIKNKYFVFRPADPVVIELLSKYVRKNV